MKLETAIALERLIHEARLKVRKSKGHDYAKDEECLLNFQNVAKMCKILSIDITTPHGVAMFYIILKLDRTANLVFRKKKKPKNESVWDTVAIDGANYWDLLLENLINEGIVEIPPEIKKLLKK